jgi:hypothetical protein
VVYIRLEILNISNNPLNYFIKEDHLSEIEAIYANEIPISDWTHYNRLSNLHFLHRIYLRNGRKVDFSLADHCNRLISTLSELRELNGSSIDFNTRKNAEKEYLKFASKERLGMTREEFVKYHPRFDFLTISSI